MTDNKGSAKRAWQWLCAIHKGNTTGTAWGRAAPLTHPKFWKHLIDQPAKLRDFDPKTWSPNAHPEPYAPDIEVVEFRDLARALPPIDVLLMRTGKYDKKHQWLVVGLVRPATPSEPA